jgi:hypothetical protein
MPRKSSIRGTSIETAVWKELFQERNSIRDIAGRYGLSPSAVARFKHEEEAKRKGPDTAQKTPIPEQEDELMAHLDKWCENDEERHMLREIKAWAEKRGNTFRFIYDYSLTAGWLPNGHKNLLSELKHRKAKKEWEARKAEVRERFEQKWKGKDLMGRNPWTGKSALEYMWEEDPRFK